MAIETLFFLPPALQLCLGVLFLNWLLPFVTVRSACRREWSLTVPSCAATVGVAAVTLLLPDADGVTALLRFCFAGGVASLATLAGLWDA